MGCAPPPTWGTLTPLVPLSLRAFKGEGERRIGACICAKAHMQAPNSVPGRRGTEEKLGIGRRYVASFGTGGMDSGSGGGMTWGRQIGDGASPRFLAGPRNDTIVRMWLEWAGLGIQSLAGAFEKATRGLVAVTIA